MVRRVGPHLIYTIILLLGLSNLPGCSEDSTLLQPGSGEGAVFINGYPDEPRFPWRLTMPGGFVVTGQGDSTLVDMPSGEYSITWAAVDEWILPYPNPSHRILDNPPSITFTGIYRPVTYIYPEVPGVRVQHGQEPGFIEVKWLWYLSAEHPTDHYAVAMNTAGPVTNENWNESEVIIDVTHLDNLVGYTAIFTGADGLMAGQEVWFGVRAVDSEGWMTHVFESPSLIVSAEWWIHGTVFDHAGQPLAAVLVGSDQVDQPVVTGIDGAYRLGPLLDQEDVYIWTDADSMDDIPGTEGWYDFRALPSGSTVKPGMTSWSCPVLEWIPFAIHTAAIF